MDIISEIIIALAFLLIWWGPTIFVIRCLSMDENGEDSVCQRIIRFSNKHPLRLPLLEIIPTLLFLLFLAQLSIRWTLFEAMVIPLFIVTTYRLVLIWYLWKKKIPSVDSVEILEL